MDLRRYYCAVLGAIFCVTAFCADPEILTLPRSGKRAMISRTGPEDWLGDRFCFYDKKDRTACGEVTEVFPNRLEVTFYERGKTFRVSQVGSLSSGEIVDLKVEKTNEVRLLSRGGRRKVAGAPAPSPSPAPEAAPVVAEVPAPADVAPAPPVSPPPAEPVAVAPPAPVETPAPPPVTPTEERAPASASHPVVEALWKAPTVTDPVANLGLGVNFIFPMAHYEQILSNHLTVGISAQLVEYPVESGPKLTGPAYGISLNYYDGGKLQGLWAQVGAGLFQLKSNETIPRLYSAPAVAATIGWRWYFSSGLNFGLAGGLNYLILPKQVREDWNFSGALPSMLGDLSFAF